MYDYRYLLNDYDYTTYVETVINEIRRQINRLAKESESN